jgi:hypothetical protein
MEKMEGPTPVKSETWNGLYPVADNDDEQGRKCMHAF